MPRHDRRPTTTAANDPRRLEAGLSRRHFFPLAIGSSAAIALALFGGADAAMAQSKTSQATAKYQDHPNKGQQCSGCNYFRPPHACQLVAGTISPNGWCSFFAKKP
jgi:hypothetical protein